MADKNHLDALRSGLHSWNSWRNQYPKIKPDLSDVDLQGQEFDYFDFRWANLRNANLSGARAINAQLDHAGLQAAKLREIRMPDATLTGADLTEADLFGADLSACDFSDAQMDGAQLARTRLIGAKFVRATLTGANLTAADARQADLRKSILIGVDLTGTNLQQSSLEKAVFENAILGNTIIVDTNLRETIGLDSCTHKGPSSIDIRTLARSGELPVSFSRGCGLSDTFIDYLPSLLTEAIQFYSCFISYSARDDLFVRKLHGDLQSAGVRCWFAPEDMKIGDRIRDRIDQSIRFHDKLLLVLSSASIDSTWVEKEVETAFEEEQRKKNTVLFPIKLDDAVMNTDKSWAADVRRARHIGDFRRWPRAEDYNISFQRLVRDLRGSIIPWREPKDDFNDEIPF
jgi:uncharacterized protein YjbI with pentapeptide repeats